MIKYKEDMTSVVFEEIPDEVTLAVNITNCLGTCVGCHSPILREDVGAELNFEVIDKLMEKNRGITCFCFMGEGKDPERFKELVYYLKEKYPEVKRAIYSGRVTVEDWFWGEFDYIKIGPYIPKFGPLNKTTTNQRLYKFCKYAGWIVTVNGVPRKCWDDITDRFWRR